MKALLYFNLELEKIEDYLLSQFNLSAACTIIIYSIKNCITWTRLLLTIILKKDIMIN